MGKGSRIRAITRPEAISPCSWLISHPAAADKNWACPLLCCPHAFTRLTDLRASIVARSWPSLILSTGGIGPPEARGEKVVESFLLSSSGAPISPVPNIVEMHV